MSTPEVEMGFGEAVKEAMAEEMRRDPTVFLMGEDVGAAGGCSRFWWASTKRSGRSA